MSAAKPSTSARLPATVVLIGNCRDDRQESMLRFEDLMADGLTARGVAVERIFPRLRLAALGGYRFGGWRKWIGYVEKYVVFPRQLRRRAARAQSGTVFHIVDHSNAMYAADVRRRPCLITCHDLLAVRGSLGEAEAYCPSTRTGRWLQSWILTRLSQADWVVCDSTATEQDFLRLRRTTRARSSVILLGLNAPFRPTTADEREPILRHAGLRPGEPYVVMVGSDLPRKNRETALRALAGLGERWPGKLVLAGQPLSEAQRDLARSLGLYERLIEVPRPAHATLNALLGGALALLFPSYAEGFGWPVIEAQSCGCPVIASDRTSLPEVAGAGALLCPAEQPAAFGEAILRLAYEPGLREQVRAAGTANLRRFTTERMLDAYLDTYQALLTTRPA